MPVREKQIKSSALKATIKGLDGVEKHYIFEKLKGKEALRVFHNTTLLLVPILAGLKGIQSKDEMSVSALIDGLSEAVLTLEFDSVWALAEKLFFCVMVEEVEINIEEYYADQPDELYIALFHAIKLNFPKIVDNLTSMFSGSEDENSE